MKKFIKKMNKVYFCNSVLIGSLFAMIMLNFAVQFKVESLQGHIVDMQSEISSYKDEIALLEVEWAYLTRPSRLRELSEKYLEENSYTVAAQIKASKQIEDYYVASYKADSLSKMAANF